MPDIDLKGCTAKFVLEQAIERYGTNWLHVLSKVSHLSRQYIVDTLNDHMANGDPLDDDLTKSFQQVFLDQNSEYINSVILSRFEIIQMTSSSVRKTIEHIKILIDGSVIHLDFFDQFKTPTKNDCIRTMHIEKSGFFQLSDYATRKEEFSYAEKWLSVLETLESEDLKFSKVLQGQLDYLSRANSYKTPLCFGANIPKLVKLYEKKNKNHRYVKAITNVEFDNQIIFHIDSVDLLSDPIRG